MSADAGRYPRTIKIAIEKDYLQELFTTYS